MHANTHTLQSSTPRAFSRYSLRVCIIVTYTLTHSQSQREGRLHVHAHTREFSIHELFQGTLFVCVSSSHIHENTHTDNTHKQHTLIHIHTRKHTLYIKLNAPLQYSVLPIEVCHFHNCRLRAGTREVLFRVQRRFEGFVLVPIALAPRMVGQVEPRMVGQVEKAVHPTCCIGRNNMPRGNRLCFSRSERETKNRSTARAVMLAVCWHCAQCIGVRPGYTVGFAPPLSPAGCPGHRSNIVPPGITDKSCPRILPMALCAGITMNEGFSAQRGVQAFPSYDFADTKSFSGWEVRQRNTEQDCYAQSCTVPWTHFLELAALRTVVATSPVEAKLADWRAGSLAAGALVGSWDVADNSIETKKQDVLTGMKWERVLSAEVDIGLKLSLWKSQARARRQQEHWNVGNAVLSLDFERSAAKAQAFSPEVARKKKQPASFQSTVRLRDNTVPGRGDVGRGGERMKNLDRSGEPWILKSRQVSETPRDKVASYTRDIVRVAEPDALTVGNKILLDMIRKGVHPTTIFFNALLAACTGKSVASGVGQHDSRGSSPASTAIGADGSRRGAGGGLSAFTVRRRASTGASRASAAAGWGRDANQRWSDCRQVLLLMKTHDIAPDTATLNVLVDACVKQGGRGRSEAAHVEQALRVLNAFSTTAGVAPDVITYTSLVTGCASALRDCPQSAALPGHRDAERVRSVVRVAVHVLEKMAASDIAPNAVTCTTALDLGVHIILRSPPGSDAQEHGRILCQNIILLLREVPEIGRAHV